MSTDAEEKKILLLLNPNHDYHLCKRCNLYFSRKYNIKLLYLFFNTVYFDRVTKEVCIRCFDPDAKTLRKKLKNILDGKRHATTHEYINIESVLYDFGMLYPKEIYKVEIDYSGDLKIYDEKGILSFCKYDEIYPMTPRYPY